MTSHPVEAAVTGAGRGLGRAIAEAFAAEGMHVWICSDNSAELSATAALIERAGGSVDLIEADLADSDQCTAFATTVASKAKRLQVIVNNAGVLRRMPVLETTLPHWSQALAVMLTATFLITRDLLPLLQREGGSVICVSSRSAVMPFAGEAAYCAAKYGTEAFAGCLALELRDFDISVNTITPGLRIKPTSITAEQIATIPVDERKGWNDPIRIMPAFVFLANLRGGVTGRRFDALQLTNALQRLGHDGVMARIEEYYR